MVDQERDQVFPLLRATWFFQRSNGALEQVKDDGSRVILYRIGSSKECASALRASPLKPPHPARRFTIDGRIVVRYSNGDMKETATDGTITRIIISRRAPPK